MAKNKVEFGLNMVHVAFKTEEGWEVPKRIPGAVTYSAAKQTESDPFYADDEVYYQTSTDQGSEGELSFALLPDWFLGKALGYKKLSTGGIVEIAGGVKKDYCLIFERKGDKERVRYIIPNCQATATGDDNFKTQGSGTSITPEVIKQVAKGITLSTGDRIFRIKYRPDDANYNNLFTQAPNFDSLELTEIEG